MSSKARRRWNAICSNLSRSGDGVGEWRRARSREEIIVEIVNSECGQTNSMSVDDFASDMILELWESKKFGDDFDAVREFVRAGIRRAVRRDVFQSRAEIDLTYREGGKGDVRSIDSFCIRSWTRPMQELRIEAQDALRIANALPKKQRECLLILADGGNPIDVANDMAMQPWDAIRLLKEARENVHRVDGLDEAA